MNYDDLTDHYPGHRAQAKQTRVENGGHHDRRPTDVRADDGADAGVPGGFRLGQRHGRIIADKRAGVAADGGSRPITAPEEGEA